MITLLAATMQIVSIEYGMTRGSAGEYTVHTIKPVSVCAGRLASRCTVCSGTSSYKIPQEVTVPQSAPTSLHGRKRTQQLSTVIDVRVNPVPETATARVGEF